LRHLDLFFSLVLFSAGSEPNVLPMHKRSTHAPSFLIALLCCSILLHAGKQNLGYIKYNLEKSIPGAEMQEKTCVAADRFIPSVLLF
jgi:hypothetical protein